MDDLEFDFEDEINATDVGQPQQAPETLPERAKKNYRQVRATHAGAPESERAHLIADRHRNNPKRRRGRSARYGKKGVRADTLRSERSSSFPLGLACAHVHSLTS
jgi:hypothetical protein